VSLKAADSSVPADSGKAAKDDKTGGTAPRRARSRRLIRPGMVPYLMVVPALLVGPLVHLIPMVGGLLMSLVELTQFYIRNCTAAP